jgi:hypothetical protein
LAIQLAVDEVEDRYEHIARFKKMEMNEEITGIRV